MAGGDDASLDAVEAAAKVSDEATRTKLLRLIADARPDRQPFELMKVRSVPAVQEPTTLSPVEQKKIAELIAALGDAKYSVRDNAQEKLANVGVAALPALANAVNDADAERSMRVRQILDQLYKDAWKAAQQPWLGASSPPLRITVTPSVKVVEVVQDGKRYRIVHRESSFAVHVAWQFNGKAMKTVCEAESLAGFREQYPFVALAHKAWGGGDNRKVWEAGGTKLTNGTRTTSNVAIATIHRGIERSLVMRHLVDNAGISQTASNEIVQAFAGYVNARSDESRSEAERMEIAAQATSKLRATMKKHGIDPPDAYIGTPNAVRFGFILKPNINATGMPVPLIVDRVVKGMPAEAAGLKAGDKIMRVNGRFIWSLARLCEVLAEGSTTAVVDFVRDGSPMRVTIDIEGNESL